MKKIILTGGGTAGHVTPNIALIPELKKAGYEIHYIGSYDGIERQLIEELKIPYYGISSGKLRRYLDPKNFTDPFKVLKGYREASSLIKKLQPNIVFSKGGFVAVPVVIASKRRKVPVIIHESDITPGLANKLCIPCATKICVNFPETLNNISTDKAILTGSPIRQELFSGNRIKGLEFCKFSLNKPVILIMGGSLGAAALNNAIRNVLPSILKSFQIIHLCGKGKLDTTLNKTPGYVQFEYIKKELSDLLSASDLIISRAGANAICEILALKKPNILIPLSASASRGDQLLNADSFARQGFSYVIKEENLTEKILIEAIEKVYQKRTSYLNAMNKSKVNEPIKTIINLINQTAK